MEQQQLNLRDIHLPDTIGWWPPALGWWLLIGLLILLCVLAVWLFKQMTRKTAVKTAKKMLAKIKQDSSLDDKQKLIELSALLRRVAISISPRNETASLTGQSWLEYLDSSVKGAPFTQGAGIFLADTHYQPSYANDLDMCAVFSVCENWLKTQKIKK